MLKLYGCPNTRSMRAAWALEEAGAEYDYQTVLLSKGAGRRPSFLRLNPSGKVPVLVDGDFVLTESVAICTYIGDLFPASGLTPPWGTRERACYNQWMAFAIAEMEQPLWTIAKHRFALPKELRVPEAEEGAKWDFTRACRAFEKGIAGRKYIVGDHFTAADILLTHSLAWAVSARIPVESEALQAYAERLLARPARARATAREAAGEMESAT
ncbi:MAG: glutathione S-transferase family protein [Burkholderiales bacterium]